MANQLHVAHSSLISGAGIVAGRMLLILFKMRLFDKILIKYLAPYYCAGGSSITATSTCMLGLGIVSLPTIYNKVTSYASSGLIDPISNLKDDKVYIYHGLLDVIVAASKIIIINDLK